MFRGGGQATELLGAGVLTSLFSCPCHRDQRADFRRRRSGSNETCVKKAPGVSPGREAADQFSLTPQVDGTRDLWSKASWVTTLLCDIRLVAWLLWVPVEGRAVESWRGGSMAQWLRARGLTSHPPCLFSFLVGPTQASG